MITIVPAAGKSQRFKDAGFYWPKQFLIMPRFGDALIWHVLNDLPEKNLFIIANESDRDFWFKRTGRPLIFIEKTKGPLDTTIQGLSKFQYVYPDQELLIVYSDVIFGGYGRFLYDVRSRPCMEGAVVFKSDNPRFDYVNGMAYAGIFYFRSFDYFLRQAVKVNGSEIGIPSVLKNNSLTHFYSIHESERIDLGTPEDYESYMAVCKDVE